MIKVPFTAIFLLIGVGLGMLIHISIDAEEHWHGRTAPWTLGIVFPIIAILVMLIWLIAKANDS